MPAMHTRVTPGEGDQSMLYDRQLLLAGAKRNALLELREVQRYGSDSYADADYVSIYGMRPSEWFEKGIRLLGRTAVECTRDDLGKKIGEDVAALALKAPGVSETLVVDPFAGSGNTLYWLLRSPPTARGLGFELDARVFQLTQQNLAAISWPASILNVDYRSGLAAVAPSPGQLLVVFVAPPWGDALDTTSGLDLARTTPPITEIIDLLAERFQGTPMLCAIQVFERIESASLEAVQGRFAWSQLVKYTLNAPGHNHGLLLGTTGWHPMPPLPLV
jgi:hypothetical protein